MKDLKDLRHIDQIRTASLEQVRHWIKQSNCSGLLTMRELLERQADLEEELKE